jgi:hypothetical protein
MLQVLRDGGFEEPVILTSETTTAAQRLQNGGATFVLLPCDAAGERATAVIHQTLQDLTHLEEVRAIVLEEQPTDP